MDRKDINKSNAEKIADDIVVEIKAENKASASSSEYEFVTETIKKKPVNKKRALRKFIHSVGMGLVAGIVACVIFVVVEPIMYAKIHPEQLDVVSIPQDEDEGFVEDVAVSSMEEGSSEITDTTSQGESDELKVDSITVQEEEIADNTEEDTENEELAEKADENDADKESEESTDTTQDAKESEENAEAKEIIDTASNYEISLDDYKLMYRKLNEVANVAKRSLTTVKGLSDSTDWFKNSYETSIISTGIIVADNGKELLIITNSKKLATSKEIEVSFCDSRSYKGTVKKADPNTDLVVVAVLLDEIDELTKNSYAKATLGNSMIPTLPGTPVLAIGAPLGIEDSIATGIITSNTKSIEHNDNNIRLITTDIYGSTDGSGVIIDLEGRVLGIIFQGGVSSDMKNLVHAYAISDIKSIIEKLSNGQDTAFLGIIGEDVTQYAVSELNVPEGAYVKQVVVDSPAMDGGIQNGDIIVKLGTKDIKSFSDYTNAINKSQPGDIAVVTVMRPGKDEYKEFSYEITLEAYK